MQKIWLIGCGRMGSAMLDGWVKNSAERSFVIVDHQLDALKVRFTQDYVSLYASIEDALAAEVQADAMIFALKPYQIEDFLTAHGAALSQMNPLFMTVIAGKRMAFYEALLGQDIRLIRTMPNTPGAIGKGITAAVPNDAVLASDKALCENLFEPLGAFMWGTEDLDLDKVTAVSGSGPAYVFLFMEAMIEKAKALGFDEEQAKKLVFETVIGAAEFAKSASESVTQLRLNVCSPNGTTERAIQAFETKQDTLRGLVDSAMEDCYQRSIELSS